MREMRICYVMKGADHAIEELILFGKYRVISTLGSGTFGTVYLAEHLNLKVYRAIKCIPKDTAHRPSFSQEEGILTEAHLLKDLNHPGIPLIYDIDEDSDFIYMIEEYISGESLDTFVLHQENISQELILKLGIQLCDILDYLHNLAPYPILYQDLKPEHIILCGKQPKLIDFGVASFFTGSGKNFQLYGTDGFVAPEALYGLPVTPAADIYSMGKILAFLAENAGFKCSSQLQSIIVHATAEAPQERFSSAADLKSALICAEAAISRPSSHLIRNIAVIGSRPGAGATHFSVALVSALNKKGLPALYQPVKGNDTLTAMAASNRHIKEQNGIFCYGHFQGMPDYGPGVDVAIAPDCCLVRDYGSSVNNGAEALEAADLIFFVLSGSDWDMVSAADCARKFFPPEQTVFICNHGNKAASKKYAQLLSKKVYCFPHDMDPYRCTAEKERLFSSIFHWKGGMHYFSF